MDNSDVFFKTIKILVIAIGVLFLIFMSAIFINIAGNLTHDKTFNVISSTSNTFFHDELMEFAKENKIDLNIDYYGDLEIVEILNDMDTAPKKYDAVWISNSIWLYMLDNSYLVTDSKSIAINSVVMAVTKKIFFERLQN